MPGLRASRGSRYTRSPEGSSTRSASGALAPRQGWPRPGRPPRQGWPPWSRLSPLPRSIKASAPGPSRRWPRRLLTVWRAVAAARARVRCSGDRAVAGVALGGGEVGCGVAAAAAAEAVGARPAGEPVAAAAAAQAVVARAAGQGVAAAVAAQQVVAVPASERIAVALGKDQVGACAAGQRVLAAAADPYRNLDRAAGLPVADGDGQDRGAAASVHGAHGHRAGGAAAAEDDVAVGYQRRVGGGGADRQRRKST